MCISCGGNQNHNLCLRGSVEIKIAIQHTVLVSIMHHRVNDQSMPMPHSTFSYFDQASIEDQNGQQTCEGPSPVMVRVIREH